MPPTNQVVEAVEAGAELAVVVGGGNIFAARRSRHSRYRERDGRHMAMLGTSDNALALQAALERRGIPTAGPVGDPDAGGRRRRHTAAPPCATGEGAVGDLRLRHRNPFFTTDPSRPARA